ncbi:MAG: hypothetical protein ACE5IJ_05410 [Thermoplasmata archaeon]
MIPDNIDRSHVLSALEEIDRSGIPAGRGSRRYLLVYREEEYPPKYVVALANRFANGVLLDSALFSGGYETNHYLQKLGFEIRSVTGEEVRPTVALKPVRPRRANHSERCPICKQAVAGLLEALYGNVRANHRLPVGTWPRDFRGTPHSESLGRIIADLMDYRGHHDFVRTGTLPRVDFYVPNPGFVIEFDESQHFTSCRKLTLERYPADLELGYDHLRWVRLCEKIDAHDPDPPYRDEQRAWYDTLRDFLPSLLGLRPTVRLYAGDRRWCDLNPARHEDRDFFRSIVQGGQLAWRTGTRMDPDPSLARLVLAGPWTGEVEIARRILLEVCDQWPEGIRVDCLVTCGAFLTFDWPQKPGRIPDNLFPSQEYLEALIEAGQRQCDTLLRGGLWEELARRAEYLTLGVDSYKARVSLSNVSIRRPHVEMVTVVDLSERRYHWTGKTYPTSGQEAGLVRFPDVRTHFQRLRIGDALILGCHDLTAFHPRGRAVTKEAWRREAREAFYRLLEREAPTLVLHHPHTTDSVMTWTAAWNELIRVGPSVERYVGAGRYHNEERTAPRSDLVDVLKRTKLGPTLDIIVSIAP